jgi:hypothetical protein
MTFLDFVLVLLAFVAALFITGLVCLAMTRILLRRRLRLHPKRRAIAPSTWLASPRQQARAHRRLRTATSRARFELASLSTNPASKDPALVADVVERLHLRAYELEHALLSSARTPRLTQRTAMPHLWASIVDFERRVDELSQATTAWRHTVTAPVTYDDHQPAYHATIVDRLDDVAEQLHQVKVSVAPRYRIVEVAD